MSGTPNNQPADPYLPDTPAGVDEHCRIDPFAIKNSLLYDRIGEIYFCPS